MIGQATVALFLICAGKPLPAASAEADDVGVIRLPVTDTFAELIKGEPPPGRMRFVGEEVPQREWIIGGSKNATTGKMTLVRLRKSNNPFNQFSFEAGFIHSQSDEPVAFEKSVEGNCFFSPASNKPKGEAK